MRWGEATTLEFVKLYLREECLWNPDHPGYKNKFKRQMCYNTISAEFETFSGKRMSIPEIKNKIKSLRSTYAQQVQKILQKSSPDAMYEPSLVWFTEMDRCLRNIPINIRQSIVTKFQQEQPEVDSSQMWVDPETLVEKTKFTEENPDPLTSHTDEEYSLVQTEQITVKKEPRALSKRIKKKKFKHRTSCLGRNTDAQEDEFDIYGKYIASQLRQMDLQKALRLQLEIQSLVSEARISDLS
ncbi:alcohol dehydrogenase transcription factor myb/SANT-like domain-containing protein [Phthorimaea operculella]|nr:alcohol dehydrogenase transcription factor myb/SANT-like domain-containing protein [Phthorimaea operculella]